MSKEKLQEIGRKLLLHADWTAIGVLAFIFLIVFVLFLKELASSEAPLTELNPVPFKELIPSDNYKKVIGDYVQVNPDITKNAKLRPLIEFNMFDLKEVKAQEEIEKQYNEQVDQATKLYQAGKKDEALKILDSILARKPNQVRALDLKNTILPKPPTTPTPSPTP